jgi:hypothetical protein
MTNLGELTIEEAAQAAAGNWGKFECFCWYRSDELEDADNWGIFYTHNRDSGLLAQSNAAGIAKALKPFADADEPDVVFESHNHWAVGHVDGFSILVYRNGQITAAFRAYHELTEQLADYPILDEEDYSRREYEATLENIGQAAWSLKQEFNLPSDWESDVYSWLSDNRDSAIENRDDQGGWPEEADLKAALAALGYERA